MSRLILAQLNDAESALRENLHRHDLDPTAQAHMDRALAQRTSPRMKSAKHAQSSNSFAIAKRSIAFWKRCAIVSHPMLSP
jgi:hypothetical protein